MKKSRILKRDFLVGLVDTSYDELVSHFSNILKNDRESFEKYKASLDKGRSAILDVIDSAPEEITSLPQLDKLICEKVKNISLQTIVPGFKRAKRVGGALKNNVSMVKRKQRVAQKVIRDEFDLPDEEVDHENHSRAKYTSKDKSIAQLRGLKLEEVEIPIFLTKRIENLYRSFVDSFYEKLVHVTKGEISEEELLFIVELFELLLESVGDIISDLFKKDDFSFSQIKKSVVGDHFKKSFRDTIYKLCGDDERKELIFSVFEDEVISCLSLLEDMKHFENLLEDTSKNGQAENEKINLEILRSVLVSEEAGEQPLADIEKKRIQTLLERGEDPDSIVKALNRKFFGGVEVRAVSDITNFIDSSEDQEPEDEGKVLSDATDQEDAVDIPETGVVETPSNDDEHMDVDDLEGVSPVVLVEAEEAKSLEIPDVPETVNPVDPNSVDVLQRVAQLRKALQTEVSELGVLESLLLFKGLLLEKASQEKQNIEIDAQLFESLVLKVKEFEQELLDIKDNLSETKEYLENEKTIVQSALHQYKNDEEAREVLVSYMEEISEYEGLVSRYELLKTQKSEALAREVSDLLSKSQRALQFFKQGLRAQLLGLDPKLILGEDIEPNLDEVVDIEGLSMKIREIQQNERYIESMTDDDPFTRSLKSSIESAIKSINKSQQKKEGETDTLLLGDNLENAPQNPLINDTPMKLALEKLMDSPDLQILQTLAAVAPKPARGTSYGKSAKGLRDYVDLAYGENSVLKELSEGAATEYIREVLDSISDMSFNNARYPKPPKKVDRDASTHPIMKWRWKNNVSMYLLTNSSLEVLKSLDPKLQITAENLELIDMQKAEEKAKWADKKAQA